MTTKNDFESLLAQYDYELPPHLVATAPAHPRDSAKLLIYDRATGDVTIDTFKNIVKYLPPNAVLVFNQTKVIPARMQLHKDTGGAVEALYLGTKVRAVREPPLLRVMASGKIADGDVLQWEDGHSFTVKERDGKFAELIPSFPIGELFGLLQKYGETPLPPYIKDSPLTEEERRSEYQTVFAKKEGSVAAPTAGLHFTDDLMNQIRDAGIDTAYVTLHVNLGTFAALTEEQLEKKKLHAEYYEIEPRVAAFMNNAKKEDRPIIAVGTTAVRTLESAAVLPEPDEDDVSDEPPIAQLTRLSGTTTIFLTEDDFPQFTDSLITNFHVPMSSLLMLVSAFTGREKLMELYKEAIANEMRFFSFGDGMMVL